MGKKSKEKVDIHVYIQLIHFSIQKKVTQFAQSLQ